MLIGVIVTMTYCAPFESSTKPFSGLSRAEMVGSLWIRVAQIAMNQAWLVALFRTAKLIWFPTLAVRNPRVTQR